MNREIQELREVVTKLVPLLTGKGLRVTQRGTQAYVQANAKTNKPEVVNIPSIPDNASPDFISAVAGFVDHEVAHVLFTDWKYYGGDGIALDKFSPEGKALVMTHNIIEDTMIEREIVKTFPGSQGNLDRLHRHFLEKITTPAIVSAKGNVNQEFSYLIVPMMRALSGQEIFQEFMDKNGYWKHPMIENLHLAMSDEILDMIKKARTTQDTLVVAQEIHDILFNQKKREEEEKKKQQQQQKATKGKSQDKPEKEAGEGDGTGERKHEEAGDDGAGEQTAEGGSSEEQEEGSGTSSASNDEGEETGEGEKDQSSGAGADESEGDDADGDDADGEGESEAEGDDADADGDEGDADGDEGESDADGEDQTGEDQDDGDFEEGDGQLEDEEDIKGSETGGDDSESQDGGGAGGEAGKSMFEIDPADYNPVDLSAAISKQIEKMATEAVKAADYSVFTKDEDEVKTFEVDERYVKDQWVPELEEAVGGLVGPMQKDIERLMAAQSLSVRTSGHRSGRLHSPSLYRVLQGDARVFQRKEEHHSKDTAVMLLVDNSGSMSGGRIVVAMQAAYALAQTLERVNVPSEVVGFTTGSLSYSAQHQLSQEYSKGVGFSRSHTIIMPVFKSFSERVTPAVKKRIAYQINNQIGMNTNTDGESLEYAALRLIPRRERRKVMIVLSDGQPVGAGSRDHLRETVKKLGKMGVETVGIGIQSNAVQDFYPKSMVLNDVKDLPAAVMGELKRILTN